MFLKFLKTYLLPGVLTKEHLSEFHSALSYPGIVVRTQLTTEGSLY